MSRLRTRLWRAALAAAVVPALALGGPAIADDTFDVPSSGRLVLNGHGYGHGHGMSQYGAEGAARLGKTWQQIVGFYYPGTDIGRNAGVIRVLITGDYTYDVTVRATAGLTVSDRADDQDWALPARTRIDSWRLTPSSSNGSVTLLQRHTPTGWHTWDLPGRGTLRGDGQFRADGPLSLELPSGALKQYRGVLRSDSPTSGSSTRDTVNVLRMDKYLRGVVPLEMPASWSQHALRSQSVAARTYASFEQRERASQHWQICDTTSCQVYGGASAEYATTNRAVRKTAGVILKSGGAPAFTQFSSSSGGWTSAGGPSYLAAKADPWDDWSGNTVHDWSTTIDATRLENSYPRIGRLQAIRVNRRDGNGQWGGRILTATLVGSADRVKVTGDTLRWAFGLRSTWFTAE